MEEQLSQASKELYQGLLYYITDIRNKEGHSVLSKEAISTIKSNREKLSIEGMSVEYEEHLTSFIKSTLQKEALIAFNNYNNIGAIMGATGIGKSKIGVDRANQILGEYLLPPEISLESSLKVMQSEPPTILLVVPTERLRDTGWKEEFSKWGYTPIWDAMIEPTCYASLHKYKGGKYHVILDEFHNITEANGEFFANNEVLSCMCLSATRPDSQIKLDLLRKIGIQPVYEVTLNQAEDLGIVSSFDIIAIGVELNSKDKYIEAGKKGKKFMITEKANYNYLSQGAFKGKNDMAFLMRMRFIYNLKSKQQAAQILLSMIPKGLRTLIFCGSKKIAASLSKYTYFSRPTKPRADTKDFEQKLQEYNHELINYQGDKSLNAFVRGEINECACVDALNEGHNIPNVDIGFCEQISSKELDFIQRTGRVIRFRVGHRGKIIILYARDTIDFNWVIKATETVKHKVNWVKFEDITSGKVQIF